MTPNTAPNAAERSRESTANLSEAERRLIAQAATLRPSEGLRVIEAMCALGSVAKLMVPGS